MLPPKIFGCVAYVHLHKNQRTKLDPCAVRCIFLGYAQHKKGYRCYDPATRRLYITMDVTFLETEYFFQESGSHSSLQGEMISEEQNINHGYNWENWPWFRDTNTRVGQNNGIENEQEQEQLTDTEDGTNTKVGQNNETENEQEQEQPTDTEDGRVGQNNETKNEQEQEQPPLGSVSTNHSPKNNPEVQFPNLSLNNIEDSFVGYKLPPRYNRGKPPSRHSSDHREEKTKYPIANHVSTQRLSQPLKTFVHKLSSEHIPNTVQEALGNPKWNQAIIEEMATLQKNETWELMPLPEGKKAVGCKWIFSIKYKADGTIDRYKARLVAKGYTQSYGIDYQETFSPVAKLNTVRVLLSISANLDWPLHQFDVKNMFLHGNLEEEVYMDVPPGFATSHARVVCKLHKALYGLKQSPRAWFGRFSLAMKKYGFKQSNSDHTLFLKHRGKMVTALLIYVDDMIITGNDEEEISSLQEHLATEFKMKNLG